LHSFSLQLVKYFKKEFACNGTVVQHPEYGEVVQLQGDQRNAICGFLVREGLVKKDKLKVGVGPIVYHIMLFGLC
jgi:translation initiation factor 1